MIEEGTVVGVEGSLVRVRMKAGPECTRCCACSALGGNRELEIESDTPPDLGARVLVQIGPDRPWLSTLLLFVLPLVGLVTGVIVGAAWRPFGLGADAAAILLGFALLLLLFAAAAAVDRIFIQKEPWRPRIIEVLGPN